MDSSSLPPPPPLAAGYSDLPGAGIHSTPPQQPTQSLSLAAVIGIIAGLLGFTVCAIVFIRFLFRRCSRRASEAEACRSAAARRARVEVAAAAVVVDDEVPAEARRKASPWGSHVEAEVEVDDDELPVFTMAAALVAPPRSAPDCAVCLASLAPDDELRLLPACRHAFHCACIDAWLRTNPVCPLCRVAVTLPLPLPPLPLAAGGEAHDPLVSRRRISSANNSTSRRSFRVELGSVAPSGRRSSATAGDDDRRTYSLGGSFDYRVDEEVEAVVARIVRPAAATKPAPTVVDALAEAAGSRGWLRQYFGRLVLSGQWSGRWDEGSYSHRHDDSWRWDPEAAAAAATAVTD